MALVLGFRTSHYMPFFVRSFRRYPPIRGFRTRPRSGRSDHPASRNHAFLPPFLLPHHSSTSYAHISMVFGPFWTNPVPFGSPFEALSIHTIATRQMGRL